MDMRIGHGYDLHRLESNTDAGRGRPFILGGVGIPHDRGPVAHSDGDALMHAVTDALLGAIGAPDIGQLFPDDDDRNESAASGMFLAEAARRVRERGYTVVNLDATVICERPRVGAHKEAMRANLSSVLGVDPSRVNIKGKTHEGVDAVGRGEAVEVHCVVLLEEATSH